MLKVSSLHIHPNHRFTRGRFTSSEYRVADGFSVTILSHGFVRLTYKDEEQAVLFGPGQWWAEGTLPEEQPKGGRR